MTIDTDDLVGLIADPALAARIRFLIEVDRLKTINRRTRIGDQSRLENSAEHSWHLAMFALVLAPHSSEPIDLDRVIRMLLLHDIVEIDAGDVFLYDTEGRAATVENENAAADRLYGLLPEAEGAELRELWEEFEERETPEARFAASVDRLQPLLLNLIGDGRTWSEHGIGAERVHEANAHIAVGSVELWELAKAALDRGVEDGLLDTRKDGAE